MKKLLIIGGSHRDIPLINAAKNLGYYTITLGNLDYYIGYKFSNKNYKIDFTNTQIIRRLIEEESIDYIIPGSGELPMKIAVELSTNGNYDTKKVIDNLHSKDKFKELCKKLDVNTPQELSKELMKFPAMVKATDLSGGKGIFVVNNKEELINSIKKVQEMSSRNEVIIEEFIQGKLIACSAFFYNQKIIYSFFAEEFEKNYYVTTTVKTDVSFKVKRQVYEELERIANNQEIVNGLVHLQFLLKDEKAYFLEVTRRIPGDLFPNLIEYCDGINYSKAVINSYLNSKYSFEGDLLKSKDDYNIRHCILSKQKSIYNGVYIDENIELIEKVDIFEKGQVVNENQLVCIVIIKYKKEILENIEKLIYVKGTE